MSENGDSTINDLMKKIIIIDEKINQLKSNNEDDKEKMNKIFEKKQIGRPAGSFEDKQKQYMDMLKKNKIKSPKQETIEFYKLFKNEEGKYETI